MIFQALVVLHKAREENMTVEEAGPLTADLDSLSSRFLHAACGSGLMTSSTGILVG